MNDLCGQQDAADYEALRSQAAQTNLVQGSALLPRGLAEWLKGPSPNAQPPRRQPPPRLPVPAMGHRGPLPAAIASIVQRLAREAADA